MTRVDSLRRVGRLLAVLGMAVVALGSTGCASLGSDRVDRYDQRMAKRRAALAAAEAQDSPEKKTLEERLAEGDRLQRTGNERRAMWRYLEAHQLDPESTVPRERIGFIHLAKDPVRAGSIFQGLVDEDPTLATAHTGLGLALLSQGRLEAARTSLEQATRLAPDSALALYSLAVVYDLLRDNEGAREQAQRAYSLSPDDAQIVNNLGMTHLLGGRPQEAEQAFRTAILLDPRDAAYHNNLGLALGRLQRYDEALHAFRKFGSDQAAYNNLGYAYYLNDRVDDAIAQYERALVAEGGEKLVVLKNLEAARAKLRGPARHAR